nr:3-oxoacyl-ACP synthase [Pseudopedobacter sp.]
MIKDFKEKILLHCLNLLEKKEEEIKTEIGNLRDGIANDSKSSMGDKYETSREMSQQEINLLEQQLANNGHQLFQLKSLNLSTSTKSVGLGSLVKTNIGNFFISVGLGEIVVEKQPVFLISAVSPLGKLIIGKNEGDQFAMNNKEIKVLQLF